MLPAGVIRVGLAKLDLNPVRGIGPDSYRSAFATLIRAPVVVGRAPLDQPSIGIIQQDSIAAVVNVMRIAEIIVDHRIPYRDIFVRVPSWNFIPWPADENSAVHVMVDG